MYSTRKFLFVYAIQLAYLFPVAFSWSFVFLYLWQAGFSLMDMFLFKVVSYGAAVASLLLVRRYLMMPYMALDLIAFGIELFALPFIHDTPLLLLLGVFDGLTFPLFWVPYNTLYFKLGRDGGNAFHSGVMFLAAPMLGVVAPAVGGWVYEAWGYTAVYAVGGAVLTASGLYLLYRGGGDVFRVDPLRAWRSGAGVRLAVFIQGFWQSVDWVAAPVYMLYLLSSAGEYGAFLSAVALFGAFASLYLCRRSDASGSRGWYLNPPVVLTAAATIFCAFAPVLAWWFILRAAVSVAVAVSNPFMASVVVDRMGRTAEAMYLREIMLNLGRTVGMLAIIASEAAGGFMLSFALAGVLLLLYPLSVGRRRF